MTCTPSVDRLLNPLALTLHCGVQVLTEPGGILATKRSLQRRLQAITLNNLGCYHRHCAEPSLALHALQQAAALEQEAEEEGQHHRQQHAGSDGSAGQEGGGDEDSPAAENPAGTLLNICAVLSSMGRHEEALDHARSAQHMLAAPHGLDLAGLAAWCTARPPAVQPRQRKPLWHSTLHVAADSDDLEDERTGEGGSGIGSGAAAGAKDAGLSRESSKASAGGGSSAEAASHAAAEALKSMSPSQQSGLAMALYNEAVELEHLVRAH